MTETQQAAPQTANGQAPAPGAPPAPAPCEDCATSGERALAVVAGLFGLFVLALAVDIFTGGKVSRLLAGARAEASGDS